MTNRLVAIGELVNGLFRHQQGAWTPGSDRLADPEGRILALASEIGQTTPGSSQIVFVSEEDGDDNVADGSPQKPYKTLAAAAASVAVTSDVAEFRTPYLFHLSPGNYPGDVSLPVRRNLAIQGSFATIAGDVYWEQKSDQINNDPDFFEQLPSLLIRGTAGGAYRQMENRGLILNGRIIVRPTADSPNPGAFNQPFQLQLDHVHVLGDVFPGPGLNTDGILVQDNAGIAPPALTIAMAHVNLGDEYRQIGVCGCFGGGNFLHIDAFNCVLNANFRGNVNLGQISNCLLGNFDYSLDAAGNAFAGRIHGSTYPYGTLRGCGFIGSTYKLGSAAAGSTSLRVDAESALALVSANPVLDNINLTLVDSAVAINYADGSTDLSGGGNPTAWAAVAPGNVNAALDRLASQFTGHVGTQVP